MNDELLLLVLHTCIYDISSFSCKDLFFFSLSFFFFSPSIFRLRPAVIPQKQQREEIPYISAVQCDQRSSTSLPLMSNVKWAPASARGSIPSPIPNNGAAGS